MAILALWGMAIVFVLLAAASFTTRTELQITRNELAAAQVRAAAEGGAQLGLARLLARRAKGAVIFDGTPQFWQDGPVRVAIAIADEAGKIDLNQAPPALLAGLFAAVGQTKETAFLLACRVAVRRGGAVPDCPEPPDAAALRPAAFAAPEELAALPGFGDRLYAKWRTTSPSRAAPARSIRWWRRAACCWRCRAPRPSWSIAGSPRARPRRRWRPRAASSSSCRISRS